MWNYKTIKQVASETDGLSTTDLIVLAAKNDPFYMGTPADRRDAEWFAHWYDRLNINGRIHLRGIHYLLISQRDPVVLPRTVGWTDKNTGLKRSTGVYVNENRVWEWMQEAAKKARYLGLVDIEAIKDQKNSDPILNAYYLNNETGYSLDLPDLEALDIQTSGYHMPDIQPYHLEVWTEKSTVVDALSPVCRRYGANLVVFSGFATITASRELITRIEAAGGKPARIFYVSDHDPAGFDMPVAMSRVIEWMVRTYGLDYDIKIAPAVLTAEQVERYQLPLAPPKKLDKRGQRFAEQYGGVTELDALLALLPGELESVVESALSDYYSREAERALIERRAALRQAVETQIEAITDRYQDEIEAIRSMFEELESIDIDAAEFAVNRFDPHVVENDSWMFDSTREYLDQLVAFKAHQDGE